MPDFSSKDIFTPTSERTRLILSAFINFVKFSEQCIPFVAGIRGKAADLIQEREDVSDELSKLEIQLAQLKCDLCLLLPEPCLNDLTGRNEQKMSLD